MYTICISTEFQIKIVDLDKVHIEILKVSTNFITKSRFWKKRCYVSPSFHELHKQKMHLSNNVRCKVTGKVVPVFN
jgi:hypothetical protein